MYNSSVTTETTWNNYTYASAIGNETFLAWYRLCTVFATQSRLYTKSLLYNKSTLYNCATRSMLLIRFFLVWYCTVFWYVATLFLDVIPSIDIVKLQLIHIDTMDIGTLLSLSLSLWYWYQFCSCRTILYDIFCIDLLVEVDTLVMHEGNI